MQKSRIGSEYLIKTVKRYECIWNRHCPEYQKKSTKENAWNEICEELIEGWSDLGEQSKIAKQWEIKKRWNNIRDYYRKDLAQQLRSPIGQSKRSKYMFSKTLEFLRPVMETSRTYETQQEENQDEQEVYLEEHLYSSDEDAPILKRKEVKLEEDKIAADDSYVIPTRSTKDDCDWLFLRSLLSDMKEMNRAQKLEFKMGVLKLYKNIMFEVREEYEDENFKNPLK